MLMNDVNAKATIVLCIIYVGQHTKLSPRMNQQQQRQRQQQRPAALHPAINEVCADCLYCTVAGSPA